MPVALGELTVVSKDQFAFRIILSPMVEVVDARVFGESQPPGQNTQYYTNHVALPALAGAAALEAAASNNLRELIADPAPPLWSGPAKARDCGPRGTDRPGPADLDHPPSRDPQNVHRGRALEARRRSFA